MRRTTPILLILFLVTTVIVIDAQTRKSASLEKSASKQKQALNKRRQVVNKRRKEVEAMLLRGEYHHDGSGELQGIGTMDSVPALLKVLELHPGYQNYIPGAVVPSIPSGLPGDNDWEAYEVKLSRTRTNKSYICTYIHAVHALRKITGQNLTEYDDWVHWWSSYQKKASI